MKKKWLTKVTAAVLASAMCVQVGFMAPTGDEKTAITAYAQETETVSDDASTTTSDGTADKVTTTTAAATTTEVTTTQAAVTTTTAASTTQAAAATTAADAMILNKDTGFGFAIMNGEEMTLELGTATTAYIPITVADAGYLTIMRSDKNDKIATISVLGTDKVTEILKPETVAGDEDTGAFAINAGSYYIKVEALAGCSFTLSAKMTTGVEMKSGKKTAVVLGSHDAKTQYYMEITAGATGLLSLENMGGATVKTTLCNSSKKAVSAAKSLAKYSSKNHKNKKNIAGFGVKKGENYLIRITAAASVKKVTLKYTIKSHATVGASSMSKAKTLKKGKTVGATLAAGAKPSYFKFKKSSYAQKRVTLKTFNNQGKVSVKLYYKEVKGKKKGKILPVKVNGKQVGWTQKPEYQSTLKIPYNWPKVTYYLKVSNATKTSSGSYYLTVK